MCRIASAGKAGTEYGERLAGIQLGPKELLGTGDHRTQAYNYRVSLTFHPENRALFPKPEHYDPEPWQATYGTRIKRLNLERFGQLFTSFDDDKLIPNDKLDTNWCDLLGGSEGYAEGDWETRARIEARHRDYFLSLLYYLQNDPELPAAFHADAQNWGLPLDEFTDNGHFPFQIYVREARRMLGRYVLSERDLTARSLQARRHLRRSYGIDCHWVSGVPDEHGHIMHEGGMHGGGAVRPYDIPYACLTPHEVGQSAGASLFVLFSRGLLFAADGTCVHDAGTCGRRRRVSGFGWPTPRNRCEVWDRSLCHHPDGGRAAGGNDHQQSAGGGGGRVGRRRNPDQCGAQKI